MRLYVYGTLRRGCRNHEYLRGVRYLGKTKIPNMGLNVQGLPYVIPVFGKMLVVEIYDVDKKKLKQIDTLEGHPVFYERFQVADKKGKLGWLYIEKKIWQEYMGYDMLGMHHKVFKMAIEDYEEWI